jgi:hypothetical protein
MSKLIWEHKPKGRKCQEPPSKEWKKLFQSLTRTSPSSGRDCDEVDIDEVDDDDEKENINKI